MSENCARPDCELPVVARVSEDDQFGRTQTTPTCQDHLDWMMFGLVAPTVDVIEQVSIRRGDQMTTTTTRSECAHNGCDRPVVARILEGDQRVWAVCQDHVVALVSHPPALDPTVPIDSTVSIDTATVTSDWVRELLYLTEQRERRDQQRRAEAIGRASMLFERPTIGAYRQQSHGMER
jgi:hypothetical protein